MKTGGFLKFYNSRQPVFTDLSIGAPAVERFLCRSTGISPIRQFGTSKMYAPNSSLTTPRKSLG